MPDCPASSSRKMDAFAELTGRQYRLFDYYGHPEAECVAVIIGSGAQTLRETVAYLERQGEKVGVVNVRLCAAVLRRAFLASTA